MSPLWQQLEAMPSWEAVAADWRRNIGESFDALMRQRIIAPNGKFAAGHPCARKAPCGCWHRQKPGTLTMVCDCEDPDCHDFTVTREDLMIHRLDTPRIADAIRGALSVKKPVRKLPEYEGAFQLGTFQAGEQFSFPVFLILPSSVEGQRECIAALSAAHDRIFATVLFTRNAVDSRLEATLRSRVLFVFADGHLRVAGDGTISCVPTPSELFSPLIPVEARRPMTATDAEKMLSLADKLNARRRRGPTARELISLYCQGGKSLHDIADSRSGWKYGTVRNMAERLRKGGVDLDAIRAHFTNDPEEELAAKGLGGRNVYRKGLVESQTDDED